MNCSILICLTFLSLILGIASENGRSCYECTSVSDSNECTADSSNSRLCEKKYCTTYRREYLNPPGKINSFRRSCEDTPGYLNTVIESANHRTFYRACTENLCNSGNGFFPNGRTIRFDDSEYDDIIVVPGIGLPNDGTLALANTLLILSIIAVVLLSRQN